MPTNYKTGEDLIAQIQEQLAIVIQVPEQWGKTIDGQVDVANKALVAKVANVVALTNRAFGNLQNTNQLMNNALEQHLGQQMDEATATINATTDNPAPQIV
ncbi:MAG TPA: hypothetical protein GX743_05140 [Actinomycetales bacterium]|nr:hypothetical protein [Actinomycetales bacterium]